MYNIFHNLTTYRGKNEVVFSVHVTLEKFAISKLICYKY